jgi:two-component system LytT family response regulator
MKVRALIAEDEPLARRTLRELIAEAPWLELAGEAADGLTAVRQIDALRPDLVFLDVQMPELSGLGVLERIRHRPAVVFTTAFDRYAVAAFELEAIDYLVKPFGRTRFGAMLERVRRRLAAGGPAPPAERAHDALGRRPLTRLFARRGERVIPIPTEQVVRAEAEGDYVAVHAGGKPYLLAVSLADLEARLDPERFERVHRAHLVNLDHVREVRPFDERRLVIRLADGSEVVASRTGSQRLRARFG